MVRSSLIAAWLFIIVFYFHSESRVIVSTDSMWSIYLAQSFVREGDMLLDEYRSLARERKNYGLRKRKGHLYSYFPMGTALLASPFVWAYNKTLPQIAQVLPGFPRHLSTEELSAENMNLLLQRTIASILVALTVVVIFYLALQSLSIWQASGVALLAAFCTPLWSTGSRGLWQHGPSALLLAAALLLLSKIKDKPILAGFSGSLLAFAYIVRPTNAIAFICFGIFILLSSREAFRVFVLSSLLIFVPFVACSYDFFQRIVPPYYNASRLKMGWFFPEAVLANLLSPNRGLFFFAPILLPAVWLVAKKIRNHSLSKLELAVVAAFLGHTFSVSAYPEWWGGHCFGPRYMTEMIPYVTFFSIAWSKQAQWSRTAVSTFCLATALSFFINYQGATDFRTVLWNTYPSNIDERPRRVWDLSDLQFLR